MTGSCKTYGFVRAGLRIIKYTLFYILYNPTRMKKFFNVLTFLFIFLAFQAVAGIFASTVMSLITGNPDITATKLITAQAGAGILTLLVFHFARWIPREHGYIRSRPYMALTWSALAAIGMIIPSEWLMEQLPELPNIAQEQFGMLMTSPEGYIAIGLFAPIVEEVVFRGAILRTLLEDSRYPWLMIVISALLFSAVHLNPVQLPYTFVIGLLLGWMYYRTGSILPGMVYHWVNNSVAFAIGFATQNSDAQLIDLFGGDAMRMLMAVGFSLLILLPALFQLNIWLKRPE